MFAVYLLELWCQQLSPLLVTENEQVTFINQKIFGNSCLLPALESREIVQQSEVALLPHGIASKPR